ncbi:hypothetical protein KORDIASMS9_02129 [Kordia sp. SMS9]|uniref:hypothetical protein n=1 Tax=Kordia sp. SMS9 TaxID=2282170 RepID=UPI000E0DCFB6|nr:hypothetical protein [Kordia sp. SMS9]AXG69901.1 hypothetical protein KORDIASMS9_02129 [Kordia sp. SMS9]
MVGLGFIFIIVPIIIVFVIVWLLTKQKVFLFIPIGIIALLVLIVLLRPLFKPIVLNKSDYYGTYVIDRTYFQGKQADWQYNTFRFEIKENDSIYFYVTDKEEILNTHKGTITTVTPYSSARLVIKTIKPSHHILTTNPTIYRQVGDFFLVFRSPKFHNMYFQKGKWKAIEL